MVKKGLLTGIALAGLTFAGGKVENGVHWGYTGIIGPSYWGDLSSAFVMCKIGDLLPSSEMRGFPLHRGLSPLHGRYFPAVHG